ncbi:hypothetical protein WJX73_002050 [Symbiochloris irregularis]|uniref:FG-GAP repeat-containing protein n=1 Tax=Symbiochloris irregularis TaxID=706552 RepID=A0AAW1NPV4_9CHLO
MYKRDFGILLLSVFAVYFALQHEGHFSYHKSWYHRLPFDPGLLEVSDALPPPIVGDLNGDGRLEVITGTHDGKIQVLAPKHAGAQGDGFAKAPVMAEVSLLPAGPSQGAIGWGPVALAVGFIDHPAKETTRLLRKQVLVVVTARWEVICFDHNLQRMWSSHVKTEVPEQALRHARVREVAVHISAHGVRGDDRGRVVVGGSIQLGDIGFHGASGAGADEDVMEQELEAESLHQRLARSRQRNEALEGDEQLVQGMERARHFSYYAFEGATGEARWTHEGSSFHSDLVGLAESVTPQHNMRLDVQSLTARHFGETSCREFRESVLRALPHRWVHRADTRLRALPFRRQRRGRGARKAALADGQVAGSQGEAGDSADLHHEEGAGTGAHLGAAPPQGGADHRNPVVKAMAQVAGTMVKGSGQGRSKAAVQPHKSLPANALVAHLEEGIEAINLATGQTICQLPLPAGGLHADLNADGVPDHVQASGTRNHEQQSMTGHAHAHPCWASASSGIPPREPLFNGSICRPASLAFLHSGLARGRDLADAVQVTAPVLLPIPGPHGHYRAGLGMAVFLNSRGEVTAYHPLGHQAWQVATAASWHALSMEGLTGGPAEQVPTLAAVALRLGQPPTAVLVAGGHSAVLLSEHGHELHSIVLPATPTAPLQVVDFNGDYANDVIVAVKGGLFGYVQVRHPGGVPFSMLVVCLIAAMVIVYISQRERPAHGGRPKKGRSTERMD